MTTSCNWIVYVESWEPNNNKHFWWSLRFPWIKLMSSSFCRQATPGPVPPYSTSPWTSLGNICWDVTWFLLKSLLCLCTSEASQAAPQASLSLELWVNWGGRMWEISPSADISLASLHVPLHTHMKWCMIRLHDGTSLSPHAAESNRICVDVIYLPRTAVACLLLSVDICWP